MNSVRGRLISLDTKPERNARDEARNLLEAVFGRTLAFDEVPRFGVTQEWDSLNSIEMIFILEERYQVDIGADAWAPVVDEDALIALIESLRAS